MKNSGIFAQKSLPDITEFFHRWQLALILLTQVATYKTVNII